MTAFRIAAFACFKAGYDVKQAEIHGMSQRGGPIESHLRFGKQGVNSPLAPKGEIDAILGFEKTEASRYADWLSPFGILIMSLYEIPEEPSLREEKKDHLRPEVEILERKILVDTEAITAQYGDKRMMNMALLGILAGILPFDEKIWIEAISSNLSPAIVQKNVAVFQHTLRKFREEYGTR